MKPWESKIPQTPKQKHIKRCYSIWTISDYWKTGGKIVWLTNAQLTFYKIKYPNKYFKPIIEKDLLENYKTYIDQTIE
jgi:hypothetical protein